MLHIDVKHGSLFKGQFPDHGTLYYILIVHTVLKWRGYNRYSSLIYLVYRLSAGNRVDGIYTRWHTVVHIYIRINDKFYHNLVQ